MKLFMNTYKYLVINLVINLNRLFLFAIVKVDYWCNSL